MVILLGNSPRSLFLKYSNLLLKFGCLEGYTKCNVRFRITYSVAGEAEQELVNRVHGFGEWEDVAINLTQNNQFAMMNRPVSFIFYFHAMEGSTDNLRFHL